MGGRSLQYVMLSPPSTRTDGVARLELYGDARVTGGVLTLTLTLTPTLTLTLTLTRTRTLIRTLTLTR